MASKLISFQLPNFAGGYNSYPASKSLVKDNEIPYGQNVLLDDNGSVTKRNGDAVFCGPFPNVLRGMERYHTTSANTVIAAAGSSWYSAQNGGVPVALTGGTPFTGDQETHFCEAMGIMFGANSVDPLAYTANGVTLTAVTSNGNVGDWPAFYNSRLYMTNAAYPDRIYYSNPFNYLLQSSTSGPTAASLVLGDFGTFNTDLSTTPKRNAGFLVLLPGSGLEISRLFVEGNTLYAYTKSHGFWTITPGTVNADGTLAHIVTQAVLGIGCPSGKSVVKVAQNDTYFYGGDNVYSRGEVQYYASPRVTPQSGRIQSEMRSVPPAGKGGVAATYYKNKVYVAYQTGSYNDTMIVQDKVLNAWGAPFKGINANCFLEYIDTDGTHRLLAGSAKASDPYIYEIESGTDDANTGAVNAYFETKSTDCGHPGLKKRFGFIDVFYGLLYGQISYQVYVNELLSLSGTVQVGTSATVTSGMGSLPLATYPMGMQFTGTGATLASVATNSFFRINTQYKSGTKVSVRFLNANSGEQFKINSVVIHYLPGSIYEL